MTDPEASTSSFLARHEFLIRRLHSLSGLVPVGAYMVIHLLTNASVLNGAGSFQSNVYKIHSLGVLLPWVEWVGIFIPLIFHSVLGVVFIAGGLPNLREYPTAGNRRYTLQRITGGIAFLFIFWHVFHMHGWIHSDWWLHGFAEPLGGAQFKPFNAASTAGVALQSYTVTLLYGVGVLACVYHLANGIWTSGITWGLWISPLAQQRASRACTVFGILLAVVGLAALGGMRSVGQGTQRERAVDIENRQYLRRVESGEIREAPHKRSSTRSPEQATRSDHIEAR